MDEACFEVIRRLRTCVKKKSYASEDIAKQVIKKIGKELRAYHCPYCNWFHITHVEKKNAL
jgi:hypothetical protein